MKPESRPGTVALETMRCCAIVLCFIGTTYAHLRDRGVARFTRRERVTDASLTDAIERAERGTIDADLGGGDLQEIDHDQDHEA